MIATSAKIRPLHWAVWTLLLVSAFIHYPWSISSSWRSSSDVHALMELWAALTALTAGLVIMIHYFANGSWLFLIISLGFVLQGGEDLIHSIFSFSRLWGEEQRALTKFVPGTYAAGRFILVACILMAWFLREGFTAEPRRIRLSLLISVLGMVASTFSTMVIIKSDLPSFIILGHTVTRPVDCGIVPFYVLAAFLYKNRFGEARYHTPFIFSIICSLIVGAASQIYAAQSPELYDSFFDMAHVLKIFSYVFPILGISFGTFSMYREEAEHGKELAFSVQKEKELTAALTLSAIGDAVIATDTERKVMLINKVGEELTGWRREEVTGRPLPQILTLLDETNRLKFDDPVDWLLACSSPSGQSASALLVARDGTERSIEINGTAIRDIAERTIGVVLVFRDVTEKRRRDDELLNAKKLESIALLTAGIAHEINNPLTNASLNLEILQESLRGDQVDAGHLHRLEQIEKNVDRASDIASALLHFSRQSDYDFRAVDVNDLIRSSLTLLEYRLKGIALQLDLRDVAQVRGDMSRLQQVFINVISNAIEAVPQGGALRISVRQFNDHVEVRFKDSGKGMTREVIGKAFTPFFTTKEIGEGTGLGLAICHGIIKKHQGAIELSSEVGRGTTVLVRLDALVRGDRQGSAQTDQVDQAPTRAISPEA